MARAEAGYPLQIVRGARIAKAGGDVGKKFVGDGACRGIVAQADEAYLCFGVDLWHDIGVVRPLAFLEPCHKIKTSISKGMISITDKYIISWECFVLQ